MRQRLAAVPADVRLFLAMLVLLVPARIAHTWNIRWFHIDGGYYVDIAQHVRDGDGLVTDLSLYNFGYEHFPHPTSVYPLWPWLLGQAGKLLDLHALAHWLPLLLSFVAVTAAFGFGRRLWPEPVFPDHVPGLHAGHVFVIGLALQTEFLDYTSIPYTEALAWSLVLLFLWRVTVEGADLGLAWAVEIGVWLGLMYLTRSQLLVAPIAAACVYLLRLVLGPDRARVAAHGAVALGVTGLFLGGWYLHLRGFVHEPGLGSLLRFDQNRANDLLAPLVVMAETSGPLDWLLDRADGITVAWDPISRASYHPAYHTLHWALPAALPFLALGLLQAWSRDGLSGLVARLRRPDHAHWLFIVVFAFGSLLSVHLAHKQYNGGWYFALRQGLMSLPAFVLALAWLLRLRQPLATVLGVVVLSSTLVSGVHAVWQRVTETRGELRGGDRYGALVEFLDVEAEARGGLVVGMDANITQRVGWRTEGVGYHWIEGRSTYADVRTITDRLGARYLVFRPQALGGFALFTEHVEELQRDFRRLRISPNGYVVFERCPTAGDCAEPNKYTTNVLPPQPILRDRTDQGSLDEEL